jgi:amino acid adenylation domain-containing protein
VADVIQPAGAAWAPAQPALGVLGLSRADRDAARAAALRRPVPVDTTGRVSTVVAAHAARRPDHPALFVDGAGQLSYRELADHVAALAAGLAAHGVGRGDVVVVCAHRGPQLVAAFLALEAVGAVYLPIEPEWPRERTRQVLADSGAATVLVGPGIDRSTVSAEAAGRHVLDLDELRPAAPAAAPATSAAGDEPRYVLYTSGSTGAPKGAVVEHRGMINHLQAKTADLGLTAADRVAFTAPIGFSISIWQMLCPLLAGASVVVIDDATTRFPRKLARALGRLEITVAEVVPTIAAALAREYGRGDVSPPALRWLLTTGEELRPAVAAALVAALPDVALLNAYGPTECSDDVTHHRVTEPDTEALRIPIGTPVANCDLYLLVDKGGWRAARPGEVAQLFVGGVPVGRGYLGRPDLTARAFFRDELDPSSPTGRLYRTGDLARLDDGVLCYVGRLDRQVKVGGVRMELDEIEAVVSRHEAVAECAVLLSAYTGRVEAFIVPHAEAPVVGVLLRHAREWLPSAAVPSAWHVLDRLPRNRNGKIDRQALAHAGHGNEASAGHTATAVEGAGQ